MLPLSAFEFDCPTDRTFQLETFEHLHYFSPVIMSRGVPDYSAMSGVTGNTNVTKVISSTDLYEIVSDKIQKAFDNASADLLGVSPEYDNENEYQNTCVTTSQ